jgi:hypothetical protein
LVPEKESGVSRGCSFGAKIIRLAASAVGQLQQPAGDAEPMTAKVSQEALAETIGTTVHASVFS